MKNISYILGISILIFLYSCSIDYIKVPQSKVQEIDLQIAQDFATSFMTKVKNGEYYDFQDEATYRLKRKLKKGQQKMGYLQIKEQFGDFQCLEYAETWSTEKRQSMQVFRFKGNFDKYEKSIEIRVTLNNTKKIAGIVVLPWSDNLE